MNEKTKLSNSIGNISEELLEDALSYRNERIKTISIRKLVTVGLAAVLCVCILTVCVVNAEEISGLFKSAFEREKELVDPYSTIVDEEYTADGITLNVDKIARDGDMIYVYYSLHRDEPFQPGLLCYDMIELFNNNDDHYYNGRASAVYGKTIEPGLVNLMEIPEETNDISGIIEMREENNSYDFPEGVKIITMDDWYDNIKSGNYTYIQYPWESGEYTLWMDGLYTLTEYEDENGNKKQGIQTHAKHLSVTVDLEMVNGKLPELPSTKYYPNKEFEVNDCTFKITEVKISPLNVWMTVEDEKGQIIEQLDEHFPALQTFDQFMYSKEYDINAPHPWDDEATIEHISKWYNGGPGSQFVVYHSYYFGMNVNNKSVAGNPVYGGIVFEQVKGLHNENKMIVRIGFDTPIYPDDIDSVYIYNTTPPEADDDYIIIWEMPK